MEDLFKRWTEHLDYIHSRVNQPPLITCDFYGGEHTNSEEIEIKRKILMEASNVST